MLRFMDTDFIAFINNPYYNLYMCVHTYSGWCLYIAMCVRESMYSRVTEIESDGDKRASCTHSGWVIYDNF